MNADAQINVNGIDQAEIIVSIPSYDGRYDLAKTVSVVDRGLSEFFSSRNSVIVNCDYSTNGATKDIFLGTETRIPKIYIGSQDSGGKGLVLRASLQKVIELNTSMFVIVEPDASNIQPSWIHKLLEPLEKNFQFVAPLYVHHKDEDLLNSMLIYPMTRSLYGWRIRKPVGGELALRRELVERMLEMDVWNQYVNSEGLAVCLSTLAMCFRQPMCQAFINQPRKTIRKEEPEFFSYFNDVVGTVFSLMEPLEKYWKRVKWSRPTAILGIGSEDAEPAEEIETDLDGLHERFLGGFRKYEEFWREVVSQSTYNKVQEIRNLDMNHFSFPAQTWTTILYDFAVSFRGKDDEYREHLIEALLPLFYGKALSYVRKTERMSVQQAEDAIETECVVFEENKPYLISRWEEN
ncbi:MAG: glycosyl transferase [Deltaproteobacteria bacterium]|nr:MAG: glycosyl transferase [Deltaproteobacteria bacterium]